MRKILFPLMLIAVLFSSCGEYNKVLKSTDAEHKYSYAKKYFNAKKYSKSATLLEELYTIFKGTVNAEESLYLLAQSYYGMTDYQTASQYFETYYTTYPNGEYTELSRYYSGYGLYLDSPEPRLDQTLTYKAIEQLQLYMEYYPQSERAEEAQNIMFELQEKLAHKELQAIRLYYNLGTYMGNNYLAKRYHRPKRFAKTTPIQNTERILCIISSARNTNWHLSAWTRCCKEDTAR